MLNPDQRYRLSAEQAFRSPWCSKAVYDNPYLSYLEEYLKPVYMRKPRECAPPQTDKYGKFGEGLVRVSHPYLKTSSIKQRWRFILNTKRCYVSDCQAKVTSKSLEDNFLWLVKVPTVTRLAE